MGIDISESARLGNPSGPSFLPLDASLSSGPLGEEDARRQMEILAALGAQLVQGELAGLAKRRGYGQYLKVCDGGREEDKLAKGEARCPL